MQDIIARALALRNNGSSSGASAELAQKVQKIEDEYVRATDEKDIEEISSSIEAIKQEIVDKGAEVKESLDLNSAIKAIRPLSEIAKYGAEYTYEVDDVLGKQEIIKITSEVNANDFVFITEDDGFIMFQFWDKNGRQSGVASGKAGRQLVIIKNNGTGVIVRYGTNGSTVFDYNSDGTFKSARNLSYAYKADVLGIRNTTEYTPTADYHPATKKYVDDAIPTSLKNPFPLTFTGAASATYDGSQAVTIDLPSGTSGVKSDGYKTVIVNLDADASRVDISQNAEGGALSAYEVYWIALTKSASTQNEKYTILINAGWNAGDPYIAPNNTTSKSTDDWFNSAYGHMIVQDGVVLSTNMTQGAGRSNAMGVYSKYSEITSVNFCNATFAAGCTFILFYR